MKLRLVIDTTTTLIRNCTNVMILVRSLVNLLSLCDGPESNQKLN